MITFLLFIIAVLLGVIVYVDYAHPDLLGMLRDGLSTAGSRLWHWLRARIRSRGS